jgi:ADP-Ribosyltransferase in polyvalent proteins
MRMPWLDNSFAVNGRTVKDNFNEWFRASKVVDDQGSPLRVFHGTASDFDSFDCAKSGRNYPSTGGDKGFFFTSSPGTASVYAEYPAFARLDPDRPDKTRFGDGTANIVAAYLSIQKPVFVKTKQPADKYFDYNRSRLYARKDKSQADGIVVAGSNRILFVVFDPSQIKSAISNSGLYLKDSASLTDTQAALDLFRALKAKDAISNQAKKEHHHAHALA